MLSETISELTRLLGDRVALDDDVRLAHGHDVSHHAASPPDAVAFPHSNEELSRIVRLCAAHRTPIIPYGTGTAVEGGVVAVRGGVCVDLSRMNRILSLSSLDMDATVEAGVTRNQLNDHLEGEDTGLFFPVDPGADASLGGMVATCASGSSAVRYGTMRDQVLGLTVVMSDGRIIHTGGRARKSSAGYDLTRLLIGSEGTLGIVSEVTLRLVRKPEAAAAAVCAFETIESAVRAATEVITSGIPVARLELLDEVQMGAINRYSGTSYAEQPTLFFEFHGSLPGVQEEAARAGELVQPFSTAPWQWATAEADRRRLWQARYDAYYAALALRPGAAAYVTDVCVPISALAESITETKNDLSYTNLPAPLFGHVGDGNFHVVFLIDKANSKELDEVRRLNDRIVSRALAAGGTCTGEHGIGLGKLAALEQEHGEAVVVMRAIKQALDPQNIMNPGKVLRLQPQSASD